MNFGAWLLAQEAAGVQAMKAPGAMGDPKSQVKQAILAASQGQPGNTAKVAQQALQAAGQKVAADPTADVATAVEIGTAMDKAKLADGKKFMKKRMSK